MGCKPKCNQMFYNQFLKKQFPPITCAFVWLMYTCGVSDLLLCIMSVSEPYWAPPGVISCLMMLPNLPESHQTGTNCAAIPRVINQLIVFRIQSSRFISCKPTCATWEFGWNDLHHGLYICWLNEDFFHQIFEWADRRLPMLTLYLRAENSDEITSNLVKQWNKIRHTGNIPLWHVIIRHLCGEGKLLTVGMTFTVIRNKTPELLRSEWSAPSLQMHN